MKKTLHSETTWEPVREVGLASIEPFIAMLGAKWGEPAGGSFYYRAVAGFQIVFGV